MRCGYEKLHWIPRAKGFGSWSTPRNKFSCRSAERCCLKSAEESSNLLTGTCRLPDTSLPITGLKTANLCILKLFLKATELFGWPLPVWNWWDLLVIIWVLFHQNTCLILGTVGSLTRKKQTSKKSSWGVSWPVLAKKSLPLFKI